MSQTHNEEDKAHTQRRVLNEVQYITNTGFISKVEDNGHALLEWDGAKNVRRTMNLQFPDAAVALSLDGCPVSFVQHTTPEDQQNIVVLTMGFRDTVIRVAIPVAVFLDSTLDPDSITNSFNNAWAKMHTSIHTE